MSHLDPAVRPDIRLIVADMDGILQDVVGELHEHSWPLVDELHGHGVLFGPAGGRQYHKLLQRFADTADRSFARGNAHPPLTAPARYPAPTNTENGVVRTISDALWLACH